jgi:cobalt-zinc-cadmium efflux system protein
VPHDHHHHHPPAGDHSTAFALGIGLNLGFIAIEVAAGLYANSIALLADAGHNLSDVLGLVVAWAGMLLARRPPSARFTYGLRAASILAALFNALFLLIAIAWMAWEAVHRLLNPEPVATGVVMLVAAIGIAVNGFTAWLFARGRHGDLNIRAAFLHMAADAAVSAGVVLAALAILYTGWQWLDPAASLAVCAIILIGGWGLLRDSVILALGAVPPSIATDEVARMLHDQPGVAAVHDLHIWAMSTTETALTAHLVMPDGHPGDDFLASVTHALEHRFGIGHVTLQIERDAAACTLAGNCA